MSSETNNNQNSHLLHLTKAMRPQPLVKMPFPLAPFLIFGHKPRIPSKLNLMSSGYDSEAMGSPRTSESGMNIDARSAASSDGHASPSNRPSSRMYKKDIIIEVLVPTLF